MSKFSRSRMLLSTLLGVVVGFVVIPRVAAMVARRPAALSPFERILMSEFQRSSDGRKVWAYFDRLSPAQARESGYALGQRGVVRLDDDELLEHAALLARVYEKLDPATCRAISFGTADIGTTSKSVLAVIESLDDASQRQHARLTARAAAAEFRGGALPDIGGREELKEGMARITASMSDSDRERFLGAFARPNAHSDADVCWATIELYRRPSEMPPEEGGPFVRALVGAAASMSRKRS
jgi:hypothetical protein